MHVLLVGGVVHDVDDGVDERVNMGAHGVGVGWETGVGVQGWSAVRASNTNTLTDIEARALPFQP